MTATNFHLAPPSKLVDGLTAVPIDIQSITGTLVFDGSSSSALADITIDFIAGPVDGHPIFDLRQTITDAWLDGAPLTVPQLAHHDFGGGSNAELRVVDVSAAAGSSHQLRVRYDLGLPQASGAGSYQPNLAWSAGPRLILSFGFTDLGGGRYLEAWIPANLIFDQFSLMLEISIVNTAVDHTVVSNAAVTVLGVNHWQLDWPATITALSPLLELRPTDTLEHHSGSILLPVSGTNVTVDVWKLTSGLADLPTELANIQTFLTNNESDVGHYVHGDRFVAFLHAGGMEYDGGTTTGVSALRHETFHSWWGRGIKPALARDSWWDEAWTKYQDAGGVGSVPMDFSDPAVLLSARNPWTRTTPSASYTQGRELFEGLAALLGTATLNQRMDEFYAEHRGSLTTTEAVEEWLLRQPGNDMVVDAFHRFVYGFNDPASPPDLWLKDDPAHTGSDLWGGVYWDSPDLWVRTQDDGGTDHQSPEYGQDNWFHARVRNRSATQSVQHFVVTFNVKSFAGTQFSYPNDFLPCIATVAGFDLAPGESRIVKQRWPSEVVPPSGTHACLLASLISRGEHPASGAHVWEHNNLAQKNLTIVDLEAGDWVVVPFVLTNLFRRWPWYRLTVVRPRGFEELPVELIHANEQSRLKWTLGSNRATAEPDRRHPLASAEEVLDCGGSHAPWDANYDCWTSKNPKSVLSARLRLADSQRVPAGGIKNVPITIPFGNQLRMGLRVHVPKNAKAGTRYKLHLVQRWPILQRPIGGIAVEIRVR